MNAHTDIHHDDIYLNHLRKSLGMRELPQIVAARKTTKLRKRTLTKTQVKALRAVRGGARTTREIAEHGCDVVVPDTMRLYTACLVSMCINGVPLVKRDKIGVSYHNNTPRWHYTITQAGRDALANWEAGE